MKTGSFSEHQQRVKDTVDIALSGLHSMYYDKELRFCYTVHKDTPQKGVPSFRYTAITLLGLDQARRYGLPVAFPVQEMSTDLARHAASEEDLGDKALALWAALRCQSPAADEALQALLAPRELVTREREGLIRSTELAWVVCALALAWQDIRAGGGVLSSAQNDAVLGRLTASVSTLRAQRHQATGLFQCAGIRKRQKHLADRMKTTTGFFDSQVYGAMALTQASTALEDPTLLLEARQTVQMLLKHQGPQGEWPWHYDVRQGTVIDPYPIFSVHQDGMGPMVLFEVGEALGEDYQDAVERSLTWIFGANELHCSMLDQTAKVIWRAQQRSGIQRYILQANRLAHHYRLPWLAGILRAAPGRAMLYECRSYHLGWALYAFCRPSQLASKVVHGGACQNVPD
jgi:hypothetical protein